MEVAMKPSNASTVAMLALMMLLGRSQANARDWPQWRGTNRDGKATGFDVPATWPKELKEKWKVTVGDGVATPALVGDKLYVFTRQGSNEIIRCLAVGDGKELWSDKYESAGFSGPDSGFQGPRSSPTIADGKVVTLGANGILSCYEAAGRKLWRNEDYKGSVPRFHIASSPIVVDGLCVAQLGGGSKGGVVAFDLATGQEKWKAGGESPGYASPILLNLGSEKAIVAETEQAIVAVGAADGKQLWKTPYVAQRMGYNASTPMVDGQTVIYGGSARGTKAVKFEKEGDHIVAKELWSNTDNSVQFNSPILKDGLIFGLSGNDKLFCVNAESGKTTWSAAIGAGTTAAQRGDGGGARGGRGRGMGRSGYGSIVDAGSVLVALTPTGSLVVFEPSAKEFKEIAKYKVASGDTYAYPVLSGNRVFVKDKDSVTLWTVE
jgi:outer membrane protein assembly factor BamB